MSTAVQPAYGGEPEVAGRCDADHVHHAGLPPVDRPCRRSRARLLAVSIPVVCAVLASSCSNSDSDSLEMTSTSVSASPAEVPSQDVASSTDPGADPTSDSSAPTASATTMAAVDTDAMSLAIGESIHGNPRLTVEQLPPTLAALQQAIMSADREAFVALFTEDAVAVDGGREFQGQDEIGEWGDREVLRPGSHYDVFEVERQSEDTYRWTLVFQRDAGAIAAEPRGCAITRVADDGRIAEWILGGCQL